MEYRNEWKYLLDAKAAAQVRFLMERMLTPDVHSKGTGYAVESLYFDDVYNTGYSENMAGVDDRQKYRIRRYGSGTALRLEDKQKARGYTRKESCGVSGDEAFALCTGHPCPTDPDRPVLNRMGIALRVRRLRPAVTVLYDRMAFTGRAGNVRVTLDAHVRAAAPDGFLCLTAPTFQILEPGCQILEIKFDEFLPQSLAQTLELGQMHQTAFSKYSLCRQRLGLSWQNAAKIYHFEKGTFQ